MYKKQAHELNISLQK